MGFFVDFFKLLFQNTPKTLHLQGLTSLTERVSFLSPWLTGPIPDGWGYM